MKILNLGCGNRIIEGAINHDLNPHRPEVDVCFDLNLHDWFWYIADDLDDSDLLQKPDCFDRIEMISVIEHLDNPLHAVDECWALLKVGGILVLKYPHKDSFTAYDDLTHRKFLTEYSFDYVDPRTYYGSNNMFYTDRKWHIRTPVEKRKIVKPHDRGDRINVKLEMVKIV